MCYHWYLSYDSCMDKTNIPYKIKLKFCKPAIFSKSTNFIAMAIKRSPKTSDKFGNRLFICQQVSYEVM